MRKRPLKKKPLNSDFGDAQLVNGQTYNDYIYRMKKIVLSMFEWKNLPDTMNSRYLEMCLYYKGQAALLYDENYGFINTQAVDSGYINIYGLPTLINCFSYSYHTQRNLYVPDSEENAEKDKECILVMNTFERVPTCSTIELFAMRLAEAQRTADVNIKAQRTPVLVYGTKEQEFTLKNMYAQYDGNAPVIYGNKDNLATSGIQSIKTEAPYIADKIIEYKKEIWNEFLTYIGVSNLDEKKERMISTEANSNNEVINLNLETFLAPRKQACKEFKEKYGIDIDVQVRSDLYNIIKENESIVSDYIEKDEVTNG